MNILTRAGLFALFLKIFQGIPYIITEHWSRYLSLTNNYKGLLRKFITLIVVKQASAVTTVTANLKEAMLKHDLKNNNYYVIPNAIDIKLFNLNPNLKSNPNLFKIIHISCFEDKSKNISGILRVIKKLSLIRQDFRLELVGDGIDRLQLENMAMELELKDKYVFFEGLLTGQDLVRIFQQADFMLMFSNYENMPVVINESLACGVPIISSNVGGIKEVVNEHFGLLVKAGDEEALLNSIIKMIENINRYNKTELHDFAQSNFRNEVIGKQFMKIYTKGIDN